MAGRVDQRTEKESLPGDKPRSPVRRQMTHCPHDQQVMSCVHGASDRLSSGVEGSVAAGEHGQVLRPPGHAIILPAGRYLLGENRCQSAEHHLSGNTWCFPYSAG